MAFQPVLLCLCAVISLLLSLSPLVGHVQRGNIAPAALVLWSVIENSILIINSAIWPNENVDSWWNGAGLCDIEIKLQLASSVAQAGAVAVILYTLASALDVRRSLHGSSSRRKRVVLTVELVLCYGLPAVVSILHYIVQPNRYYIFSYTGCTPSIDASWLSIPLVELWNPLFCCVAVYFAGTGLTPFSDHS